MTDHVYFSFEFSEFDILCCFYSFPITSATGGHSLIQCVKKTSSETITNILTLDYITDTVIDNVTLSAVPYLSPDVSSVVMVVKETGRILVHRITENGELIVTYVTVEAIFNRKFLLSYQQLEQLCFVCIKSSDFCL